MALKVQIWNWLPGIQSQPSVTIILISLFTFVYGSPPKLQVGENFTYPDKFEDHWQTLDLGDNDTTALIAIRNDSIIQLICTAPYPIEWRHYGHIGNDTVVKMAGGRFRDNLFELKIAMHFPKPKVLHEDNGTSCRISCQNNRSPREASDIYVFVPGKPLLSNKVRATEQSSLHWRLIPCPTTEPRYNVSLSKKLDNGNWEPVLDAKYNPVRGFELHTPLLRSVSLRCSVEWENKNTTTVTFNGTNDPAFVFKQSVNKLHSRCHHTPMIYLYIEDLEQDDRYIYAEDYYSSNTTELIGTLDIGSDRDEASIFCLKTTESEVMKKSGRFYNISGSAWKANLPKFSEWSQEPRWHKKGTTTKLQIDKNPQGPVLYTNVTEIFTCHYRRRERFDFFIEHENGTLVNASDQGVCTQSDPSALEKGDTLNVSAVCLLPITAVAVHCICPYYHTEEMFLDVQRRFQMKYLVNPEIDTSVPTEVHFITGQRHELNCSAAGDPSPSFVWKINDAEITSDSSPREWRIFSSDFNSVLEFPNVKKQQSGFYTCVAHNSFGLSDNLTFTVHVSDPPPNDTSGTVTIIVVSLSLTLAIIGILSLGLVYQYRKGKVNIRDLTDEEIEIFFKGRQELLSSSKLTQDTLELLPYQQEKEVDIDDTNFDYTVVLGTGEFAYVIKGMIKSDSREVAIKIAKPTADVTLFKSLLAEVKIMIYIGEHKNVVSIVGACTKQIRNRNVYIYMELCQLGSLEKYLRKSRPKFTDLLDEHSEVDVKRLEGVDEDGINTLTLIRWSGEIAAGMEYLAYKSIVHADLATRNVLLNANRIAKVSDFGLSKQLYESNLYVKQTKTPLPWRWMAPEALTWMSFSTKSDVYSFGMTVWEIFTLGDIPFPNESWNQDFVTRLTQGMKMHRPKFSTKEMYSMVEMCWNVEFETRPTFAQSRKYFIDVLTSLLAQISIPAFNGIVRPLSTQREPTGKGPSAGAELGATIAFSNPTYDYEILEPISTIPSYSIPP